MEATARLAGATVVMDDRAVLRGVDIDLVPGVTVLRGPNGAGKTTALRALAGLQPLVRGTRHVSGDVLYLGHRPQLLHGLTTRESLRFFLDFRCGAAPAQRIDAACTRWGIGPDADRPVERLSAGQRRRASLARLDLEACAVTLLDEPFAELDADAAAILLAWLRGARAQGMSVLVASHAHPELDAIAARTYALADGRIASAAA